MIKNNNVEKVSAKKAEVIEKKAVEKPFLRDDDILNPDIPSRLKMKLAIEIADCLSEVIEAKGLALALNTKHPEKKYLTIEAWQVLGTFLGLTPVSEIIGEIQNNKGVVVGYRARAQIYKNPVIKNGEIVAGALLSSMEAEADRSGFQKDRFAIASMAQTRALSKAYRMALSWIVNLAGYEGTGAEEMKEYENIVTDEKKDNE